MSVADKLRAHALGVRIDGTMPGTPAQTSTELAAMQTGFTVNPRIPKEKYAERVFMLSLNLEHQQDRNRALQRQNDRMRNQRDVAILAAVIIFVCWVAVGFQG